MVRNIPLHILFRDMVWQYLSIKLYSMMFSTNKMEQELDIH